MNALIWRWKYLYIDLLYITNCSNCYKIELAALRNGILKKKKLLFPYKYRAIWFLEISNLGGLDVKVRSKVSQ